MAVRITPEEFVRVWQTSANTAEVAEKTGMTVNYVKVTSYRYRNLGVKLKDFSQARSVSATTKNLDIAALNELAQSLEGNHAEEK